MLENKDQANFAPEKVEEKLREWAEDKSRVKMIEECFNFKLFPQQKELLCAMSENREVICKKPRSTGGTTVVAAYVACNMVLYINQTIVWVDVKTDLCVEALDKVDNFVEILIKRLYPNIEISRSRSNKVLMLGNNSKFIVINSNSNIEEQFIKNNVYNVTQLVFDNAAFYDNTEQILSLHNERKTPDFKDVTNVLMMSTPNYKDKMFHQMWGKAMLGLNDYEMVSFEWYRDPRFNKGLVWTKIDKENGVVHSIGDKSTEGMVTNHKIDGESLIKYGLTPTSPWYIDKTKIYDKKSLVEEIDGKFYNAWVTITSIAGKEVEPQNGPDEAYGVQPETEEEKRQHIIDILGRDYEGTVIDSKEFFKIFPETKSWFAPMIRYQNFDSLLRFVKVRGVHFSPWDFSVIKEGSDFFYKAYFYTENNEYCIHFQAVKNAPEDVYVAGYSKSRRTYPGETWTRGSDLPDGDYSYKTFCKIKDAIISNELKTLHFKMK